MPIRPSNLISLLRIPLAIGMFIPIVWLRVVLVATAALTDFLDGFVARRWNQVSKLGTILDPATDKFFAFTVLYILFMESKLAPMELAAFLSRDFAVMLFGLYLWITNRWATWTVAPGWAGKIATVFQLLVILLLLLEVVVPAETYWVFWGLGVATFLEFLIRDKSKHPAKP